MDIRPDPASHVHPGRGGMSVTPDDPSRLPPHFRPASLGGFGRLPVFGIKILHLGASLHYRPDPKKPRRHGFVEPSERMHLVDYQAALAATAPAWRQVP